jgi:glyoxylase-like metal-dependent hydrolase (beta-lactamase superfamily II)
MRILLVALAALATTARAQFPSPILSGNLTRVSEHVQQIIGFPNVVIVTGEQATLVIDTGLGLENGAKVVGAAQSLAKGKKLYLTTTHFHPEHAAGEAAFPPETILIRPAAQQAEMERRGKELIEGFRRSPNYADLLKGVETMRTPDVVFNDELRLDLGNVRVRLLYFGAGHTDGDELIFVEPDSVLVSGDLVQNKVVPAVPNGGGSLDGWLALLDKLAPLQPRIVVPTHSKVGDGGLIAAAKAFILDMRARTLALKRQGIAVAEAGTRMTDYFRTNYPDWAANTDWPNVNGVTGLVQRIYAEDK